MDDRVTLDGPSIRLEACQVRKQLINEVPGQLEAETVHLFGVGLRSCDQEFLVRRRPLSALSVDDKIALAVVSNSQLGLS